MTKRKKKLGQWIQAANREMQRKGTKGAYGKSSAKKDARNIAKGGLAKKRAIFARTMRRLAARRKKRGGARKRRR